MRIAHVVPISSAALLAGMLLVHCSSSSTTSGGGGGGGGGGDGTGTGTGSSIGSHSGSGGPSSGTGTGSSPGSSTGTGSSPGSSTGTGTGTGLGTLTDTHDAGPCVGPDGGAPCDPGNVECNNAQCAVPNNECCNGSNNAQSCLGDTATCSGSKQACDEKSDCPDGQICCLLVTNISGAFDISCQNAPTCPSGGLAHTQICKTNAECAGGECSIYLCQGNTTQACSAPNAICTKK